MTAPALLATRIPATNVPRTLGAFAAALCALQVEPILAGRALATGCELRIDAASRRLLETRLVRNPTCRGSHQRWATLRADPALALREVLVLAAPGRDARVGCYGAEWVRALRCADCGHETGFWRTAASLLAATPRCERCAARLVVGSFELRSSLPLASIPAAVQDQPLRELGLRLHDVLSVEWEGGSAHFELSTGPTDLGGPIDTILIGGLGAVGSALVPLVASMPGVRCLVLVDFDAYEPSNLGRQAITPAALGMPKVLFQADRLRELRPDLEVVPIENRVENVPLGLYRNTLVIGCVDSRAARVALTERAFRVARFQLDVAVDGPTLQARVQSFEPDADAVCLICGWDAGDFAALEQTMPCDREHDARAPH